MTAVALAMMLAGCGGDDDDRTAPDVDIADPTAEATPTVTASTPEPTPTEAPEQATPVPATIGEGRIPALPIAQVLEFDQFVQLNTGYENELILTQEALLRAIDVDSGAERQLLLSTDGLRAESGRGVLAGEHHLALLADSRAVVDLRLGVDLRTMERTGLIPSDGSFTWVYGGQDERRTLQYKDGEGVSWLDVTTMTTLDPVLTPDTTLNLAPLPDTGELAVWHQGGRISIHDPDTLEERASIDIGIEPLPGVEEPLVVISDRVLQYFDGGNVVGYIDRSSWEHLGTDPDYATAAGPDFSVRYVRTRGPARVLAAAREGERWYLLQILDRETGGVRATHVIASGEFDGSWHQFYGPGLAWVGERLFVLDHVRRVVEVDLTRIGEDTGAWADPQLPWTPVLTAEEQEVADAVIAFLADVEGAAYTDNERVQPALPLTAGWVAGQQDWQVAHVLIAGDHAWSRALAPGPLVGTPVALERVDGEWLISTDQECYNASFLAGTTVC